MTLGGFAEDLSGLRRVIGRYRQRSINYLTLSGIDITNLINDYSTIDEQ